MRHIFSTIAITATLALTAPMAQAFEISFDWKGLKRCTNGKPFLNLNPRFVLADVPAGTKYIRFKLVDRDARGYNHGGGVVAYTGQSVMNLARLNTNPLPAQRPPYICLDRHGTSAQERRQTWGGQSRAQISIGQALIPKMVKASCDQLASISSIIPANHYI